MKSLLTSLFLALFALTAAHAANPFVSFYAKTDCKTRALIISINLADCNNCIAPLGRVIKRFKQVNPEIPVYLLMSDTLPEEGEKIYSDRNEIKSGDIQFIYDKTLNDYLLSKSDGTPNVTLMSEKRKILSVRNLKTESQEKIMEQISPEFKIILNKKTAIRNKYAPIAKEYNNVTFFEKTFYIFSESMGLIAKYDKSGVNLNNFFIDSLGLDYPKLAKEFFSPEEYASSMRYYEKEKPRKGQLIAPITIFKIGEGLLGIGFSIESVRDTIFKKQSADLMISHPFIIVVDTAFRFVKRLTLNGPSSRDVVFQSQVLYQDSLFYCLTCKWGELCKISGFKELASDLRLKREYQEPYRSHADKDYLQSISNASENPDEMYISYGKYRASRSRIYKRNLPGNYYDPKVRLKVNRIMFLYETKKGNYLIAAGKRGDEKCSGYDVLKNKTVDVLPSNAGQNTINRNAENVYFLFDGFLYELTYTE